MGFRPSILLKGGVWILGVLRKKVPNIFSQIVVEHSNLPWYTLGIQSPSENGFMEPKNYAFRRWLDTPCSSAENMTIDA